MCVYVHYVVYRLNFPNCLPSLYVSAKELPQTPSSKGLLGGLFSSTPTTVDQNLICMSYPSLVLKIILLPFIILVGESARRPIGYLYNLDGKTGTVYSGQETRTRAKGVDSKHGAKGDHVSHGKGKRVGVSAQMERNVEVYISFYV